MALSTGFGLQSRVPCQPGQHPRPPLSPCEWVQPWQCFSQEASGCSFCTLPLATRLFVLLGPPPPSCGAPPQPRLQGPGRAEKAVPYVGGGHLSAHSWCLLGEPVMGAPHPTPLASAEVGWGPTGTALGCAGCPRRAGPLSCRGDHHLPEPWAWEPAHTEGSPPPCSALPRPRGPGSRGRREPCDLFSEEVWFSFQS